MEIGKCVYGDTVLISASIIIYAIAKTTKTAQRITTVTVDIATIVESVALIILAKKECFAKKVAAFQRNGWTSYVTETKIVKRKHKYARIKNVFYVHLQ